MKARTITAKNFQALLSRGSRQETTTSDIFELFLQISLVLLIIFIMMNMTFRAKAQAEVEEAKGLLTYYREKMEEIMTTEPGELYEEKEKALIELQKQKLINALDAVENQDRARLGLAMLCQTKEDGQTVFVVEGVLNGEQIIDHYFIEGCKFAKERLPFQNQMANDWLVRVLMLAGMRLTESSNILITQNPGIVNKENEQWLKEEIGKKLSSLNAECCGLQRAVVAELQKFYRQNTALVKDTEVYGIIKRYPSATPKEQNELIHLITDGLYQHAKSVFEKQGVPLLDAV